MEIRAVGPSIAAAVDRDASHMALGLAWPGQSEINPRGPHD